MTITYEKTVRFEETYAYDCLYHLVYRILINNISCGVCIGVISKDKNSCRMNTMSKSDDATLHISYLFIEDRFQGFGCGSVLLHEMMKDAYNNYNITHVSLDDASDKCHQKDNIYIKLGFIYSSDDNAMECNLRHVLYGKKTYLHDRMILMTKKIGHLEKQL
jgi:GNAT superfamily N-acetyltransferase